jgi:trehalose 6-phosphate synthase
MSRLIVISNRVAAPRPQGEGGAQGGLAVALSRRCANIAASGSAGPARSPISSPARSTSSARGVTSATIDLEEQDVEEYYNGYANRTLWPLFPLPHRSGRI